MHTCKRVYNVGSGLGLSWGAQHGAAAGLVRRCQIWTNGADLRGAERGNCMPQYKTAQSRRNVREPAGVPPWAGAGFKNFGHQLGKKTKQRVRAPPVVVTGLSSVPICQIGRKRSARLSSAWTGWTWGPCDRAGTSIGINGTDPSAQTVCASVGSCARRTPTFQKVASSDVSDLPIAP